MPVHSCLCACLPRFELRTKLVLVMHCREWIKPTATGPMALAALKNHEVHLHGVKDRPLELGHLDHKNRRVLVLFPSESALPLDQLVLDHDERPVSLVVPDGNWQQARRMSKRLFGLRNASAVTLAAGPASEWGVRRETRPGGLATFEAIARALGTLESKSVQTELEAYFRVMVQKTFELRGAPNPFEQRVAQGAHP